MAGPAILKIDIIADATKALKQMGLVEDKAKGGLGLSGLGKTVAGAVGTAAIVGFGKSSVTAAQESAVATARLESVFASMGDTTGDAAKSAEDYASALSAKIGVDDEAIMAAQAQLATFGKVSDETARTAGIFDRATSAAADLAAAGFGSLDSNSVSLGKALQDPAKGITALAKSGVTFTDAQKDQIKAMQKSGDLLGAQKIVLAAVEGQVKGTAEATATSTAKMSVKFGELQETIGNKLLPVVNTAVEFFTKYMDILIPVGGAILAIVLAVKGYQLATQLAAAAQQIWNGVQLAFNLIMSANPIMLVVLAIAALIAAVILAYNKVGWFRDFVDKSWDAVVAAFGWITDAAKAVFEWIKSNWPLLLAILTGPIGIAIALIVKNWDAIKDAISAVISWIADHWQLLLAILTGPIGIAVTLIVSNFNTIKDAATAVWQWVTDKFRAIGDFLSGFVGRVAGIASDIADAIKRPINAIIRGWNSIEFKVPSVDLGPLGTIGGQTIGFPNIPTLATGGTVLRTGLALVHAGEQFSGVGNSFGGTVINVNVTHAGLGADSPQLQREVVNALRGYVSRNGALDVPVRTA
jgi:hypothetical protein